MKDKEIILKVNTLNEEEKLKLWLEYVVETSILNHNYHIEVGKPLYHKENRKYYPLLNVTIFKYMEGTSKHRISPFEKWIKQDENNHNLTGIYYFYRLKQMRKNEN